MADLQDRYYQVPWNAVGSEAGTHGRWNKVGLALVSGLMVLSFLVMADPISYSASVPAFTALFGLTAPVRHIRPGSTFKPFTRGPVIPKRQIIRPMAEKSSEDDSLSILDTLCEVDTGDGCGVDDTAEASIEVDLTGNGKQIVDAVFELSAPENTLKQFGTSLPLGLVMEQNDKGKIIVVGADEAGNGYKDGIRIGDTLRATTCVKQKKNPDFTYWVSGVGQTGKKKALFTVDGATFAKAMKEIRSNGDVDDQVVLVVERPAPAAVQEPETGA